MRVRKRKELLMPDIGKVMKSEIARIAKREVNSLMGAHIKTIRSLKQQVAELKKQLGKAAVSVPSVEPESAVATEPGGKTAWFTGKGVAGMRKRLGLSQTQMATLCGVSGPAVCLWESKSGKLNLRPKTREALIKLRGMSPAEAKKALAGK
jgi:DNA-binding transcriptional regulator YiaG